MLVLILLLSMVLFILHQRIDKRWLLVPLLLIVVFSFIKFGFGTDYFSYANIYNKFNPSNFSVGEKIEFGYKMIMAPFKLFGVPYWIFTGIVSSFSATLFLLWIYENSENPFLSNLIYLSLFFIVWSTSALRQGIVLSIAIHIFFSKRTFKTTHQIMLILLLSTIHISALILFVTTLFSILETKKEIKKNHHLMLLLIGFILYYIPFEILLKQLAFIPTVKILLDNYISKRDNIFDFALIIRMGFFAIHYLMYDAITTSKFKKYIVDSFMFGISLYVVLKFSEITAARLTIFTFILLILTSSFIFEALVEKFSKKQWKYAFTSLLVLVSSAFFYKEMGAYHDQAGLPKDESMFRTQTIFKNDVSRFDNKQAYLYQSKDFCSDDRDAFLANIKNIKEAPYDPKDTYMIVKSPTNGKYGVLNSRGSWRIKPSLNKSGSIHGDILIFNKKGPIFDDFDYIDLSDANRSREAMIAALPSLIMKSETYLKYEQIPKKVNFDALPKETLALIPRLKRVSKPTLTEIKYDDFSYFLLKFYFYGDTHYLYLNEKLEPFSDNLHRYANTLNRNQILNTATYCGRVYFNTAGEVIWQE